MRHWLLTKRPQLPDDASCGDKWGSSSRGRRGACGSHRQIFLMQECECPASHLITFDAGSCRHRFHSSVARTHDMSGLCSPVDEFGGVIGPWSAWKFVSKVTSKNNGWRAASRHHRAMTRRCLRRKPAETGTALKFWRKANGAGRRTVQAESEQRIAALCTAPFYCSHRPIKSSTYRFVKMRSTLPVELARFRIMRNASNCHPAHSGRYIKSRLRCAAVPQLIDVLFPYLATYDFYAWSVEEIRGEDFKRKN